MVNFLSNWFGKKDSAVEASKIEKARNYFKWNCNPKYRLIGKINGLAEDARRTRFHLVKRAKADKPVYLLAARKQAVSTDIRHHLLAYAFLRGTPYLALEPRCRPDNLPQMKKILQVIEAHMPPAVLNEKSLEQWLRGETVQEVWEQIKYPKANKSFWQKCKQLFN